VVMAKEKVVAKEYEVKIVATSSRPAIVNSLGEEVTIEQLLVEIRNSVDRIESEFVGK
jgi:hypothetical protein